MAEDETERPNTGEAGEQRIDLPKWNRARVKRKVAGQGTEDAFQGGVRQAGRFTLQRAPLVIAGIVALGAIIAGVQALREMQRDRRAEATRLLATAVGYEARGVVDDVEALTKDRKHPFPVPLFGDDEKKTQAVDAALAKVGSEAEGSAADTAATLVRAARSYEIRAFSDAETAYRGFVSENPEHELLFLAREGLVLALEGQGKLDEALTAADRLVGQKGDFYRDQGLWHRARLLERQGKAADALAAYKTYVEEYPLDKPSLAQQEVLERVKELAPELVPEAVATGTSPP